MCIGNGHTYFCLPPTVNFLQISQSRDITVNSLWQKLLWWGIKEKDKRKRWSSKWPNTVVGHFETNIDLITADLNTVKFDFCHGEFDFVKEKMAMFHFRILCRLNSGNFEVYYRNHQSRNEIHYFPRASMIL